ncbi:MAG TPA: DMT family transporter, partial [Alphaproteobacteria bacterium]|nr:DMT family transporter [Alphaproteobacteria bacterium]
NWPAMKVVLSALDPWTLRTVCLMAGGGAVLAIAALAGQRLRLRGDAGRLLVAAALNVTGWHMLTAFALTQMAAGRAAIVGFTMPIWAAPLAWRLLGERFDRRRLIALALGAAALGLLLAPDLAEFGRRPLGTALMAGAALSWAGGTIATKRWSGLWGLDAAALTGWQLLLGGLPVVAGMLLWGRPAALAELGPTPAAALLYIVALPMVYCHWAWFRLVAAFPANLAAMATLGVPVVGVLGSALLIGEWPTAFDLGALALVLAALSLVRPAGAARAADPATDRPAA